VLGSVIDGTTESGERVSCWRGSPGRGSMPVDRLRIRIAEEKTLQLNTANLCVSLAVNDRTFEICND